MECTMNSWSSKSRVQLMKEAKNGGYKKERYSDWSVQLTEGSVNLAFNESRGAVN